MRRGSECPVNMIRAVREGREVWRVASRVFRLWMMCFREEGEAGGGGSDVVEMESPVDFGVNPERVCVINAI